MKVVKVILKNIHPCVKGMLIFFKFSFFIFLCSQQGALNCRGALNFPLGGDLGALNFPLAGDLGALTSKR